MLNIYNQKNSANLPNELEKKVAEKPADFRQYQDAAGDFGSKELAKALWYVRHEVVIHRLFVFGLILFVIFSWGFSLYRLAEYLIVGRSYDRQLEAAATNFINYWPGHERFAPQAVGIVSTVVVPGGVNKFDLITELSNPNNRWLVEFFYHYVVDGEPTAPRLGRLLPGENKPIVWFGLERSNAPNGAELIIEDVNWKRISNKEVADTIAWQAERLDFSVSNLVFVRADSIATSSASADIIKFTIFNKSAYSYKAPKFYAGLYNNSALAGLVPFSLSELPSLESREIDLRSFAPNLQVTEIKIFPQINPYDQAEFLAPYAGEE
ncbi:MAG: hypothetical protein Q7K16_02430 [Candidatus Azambacteria bacterium]|nr:hypothetical protein [Candidatus Azambacteria bacterium]